MITTEALNDMIHQLWWDIHKEFVRQAIDQWDREQLEGCFPVWVNAYCAQCWVEFTRRN